MSTFMANKGTITRGWYVLDAAGKPLGKTAALAAELLRGKRKPEFTPNADCGDYVIVVNAEKAVLTVKYRTLMQTRPELAMKLAIRGMLPKNTLSRDALTRLHIYQGSEHPHAAQKPQAWDAE